MVAVAAPALSVMTQAIRLLYGVAVEINSFLDRHIEEMKHSPNPTVSRSGNVLEAAKYGFGIGYITSVVIIAAGQLLLGNPLSAVSAVATAATLTNPVAMTCAALGALFYGYSALSDMEREELLLKLSQGIEIGIELIKSIIRFVIDKVKTLLSAENIAEIKQFIVTSAAVFGKTLSDVTRTIGDKVSDGFDSLKKKSGAAVDKTINVASGAYRSVSETAGTAAESARRKFSKRQQKTQGQKIEDEPDSTK